jgi:hypothetical protein
MQRLIVNTAPRPVDLQRDELDRWLPVWARRTNPIVRRHLGAYWKMMSTDPWLITRIYLAQVIFIALSIPLPFLLTLLMPTVTVSLVLLPVGSIMYGQLLYTIARQSALSMVDERRNNTLELIRAIPLPRVNILYSKVAAAVWRQVEDIGLLLLMTSLFSLPLIIIQHDIYFSLDAEPLLMRVGTLLGLAVSLLRLILEPIMIASVGVLVGTIARQRIPATIAMVLLGIAYFLLINFIRLLPVDVTGRLLVEVILPLALPLIVTALALRVSAFLLDRD